MAKRSLATEQVRDPPNLPNVVRRARPVQVARALEICHSPRGLRRKPLQPLRQTLTGGTMDKTKTKRQHRIGRPPLPPGQVRADDLRVTLRMRADERRQLEALAARWGVTVGEAIRRAVVLAMSQQKED